MLDDVYYTSRIFARLLAAIAFSLIPTKGRLARILHPIHDTWRRSTLEAVNPFQPLTNPNRYSVHPALEPLGTLCPCPPRDPCGQGNDDQAPGISGSSLSERGFRRQLMVRLVASANHLLRSRQNEGAIGFIVD